MHLSVPTTDLAASRKRGESVADAKFRLLMDAVDNVGCSLSSHQVSMTSTIGGDWVGISIEPDEKVSTAREKKQYSSAEVGACSKGVLSSEHRP
jgi:hypothetical protein